MLPVPWYHRPNDTTQCRAVAADGRRHHHRMDASKPDDRTMQSHRSLSADEVRAALRAAACRLAAELPHQPHLSRQSSEVVYTDAGAVIVEFVPRAAVRPEKPKDDPDGRCELRILNLAEFAAELQRRRRKAHEASGLPVDDEAADETSDGRRLNPTEVEILRVCTKDTPLKGMTIARRIGREYEAYLRRTLAKMVRDGLLRRSTDGRGYLLD